MHGQAARRGSAPQRRFHTLREVAETPARVHELMHRARDFGPAAAGNALDADVARGFVRDDAAELGGVGDVGGGDVDHVTIGDAFGIGAEVGVTAHRFGERVWGVVQLEPDAMLREHARGAGGFARCGVARHALRGSGSARELDIRILRVERAAVRARALDLLGPKSDPRAGVSDADAIEAAPLQIRPHGARLLRRVNCLSLGERHRVRLADREIRVDHAGIGGSAVTRVRGVVLGGGARVGEVEAERRRRVRGRIVEMFAREHGELGAGAVVDDTRDAVRVDDAAVAEELAEERRRGALLAPRARRSVDASR
jgi:hypothetical protein